MFDSFGTVMIAIIGYGCAIVFSLFSLGMLLIALIGDKSRFNRHMNGFVIAGIIAFLATFCTAVALKILG